MKKTYILEVHGGSPHTPISVNTMVCTKPEIILALAESAMKPENQVAGVVVGFFEEGKSHLGYTIWMGCFPGEKRLYWE